MKIMHLISGGDVGGAKTHVISLLEELSRDNEVELVCLWTAPSPGRPAKRASTPGS